MCCPFPLSLSLPPPPGFWGHWGINPIRTRPPVHPPTHCGPLSRCLLLAASPERAREILNINAASCSHSQPPPQLGTAYTGGVAASRVSVFPPSRSKTTETPLPPWDRHESFPTFGAGGHERGTAFPSGTHVKSAIWSPCQHSAPRKPKS